MLGGEHHEKPERLLDRQGEVVTDPGDRWLSPAGEIGKVLTSDQVHPVALYCGQPGQPGSSSPCRRFGGAGAQTLEVPRRHPEHSAASVTLSRSSSAPRRAPGPRSAEIAASSIGGRSLVRYERFAVDWTVRMAPRSRSFTAVGTVISTMSTTSRLDTRAVPPRRRGHTAARPERRSAPPHRRRGERAAMSHGQLSAVPRIRVSAFEQPLECLTINSSAKPLELGAGADPPARSFGRVAVVVRRSPAARSSPAPGSPSPPSRYSTTAFATVATDLDAAPSGVTSSRTTAPVRCPPPPCALCGQLACAAAPDRTQVPRRGTCKCA